ncbi:hypothetical protein Poly30_42150 [Planctomycetes bacterium Poly30]|uniref:Uncharacterized protein n=1 Tax=Saltatorellus ferox TaxID=2528018 RepID=A0A518EX42_9BACT|nr:hypothetical protein Poly30_42150 [Planctomycetes bacterium Poly30]
MIPHERTLVKRLQDQPFALVGINSDNEERYRKERVEMEVTWPSFFDGGATGGPIASQWGVTGWPTIYVLDHEGRIRFKGVRNEAMDRAVDTLLAEMKGAPLPESEAAKPEKSTGESIPAARLIPPAKKKSGL